MTTNDQYHLRIFKLKIIIKMFGPVQDFNGDYVKRSDSELPDLYEGQDIVQ